MQPICVEGQARLTILHDLALTRADDAERLLLTEEEYIILTKEAFWTKECFDIRHGTIIDPDVYQQRIGVKPDFEYWGLDYMSAADMLDVDENLKKGLTFVKAQFLLRSGIAYSELVDLLRTNFINPYMPKGRDKTIMNSIRLTYRYLQHLVKPPPGGCHHHRFDKFKCLVDFLLGAQWQKLLCSLNITDITSLFDEESIDDEGECARFSGACNRCCRPSTRSKSNSSGYVDLCHTCKCDCHRRYKILVWFAKNFQKIGKIVVLESGFAHRTPQAELVNKDGNTVGHVLNDGAIVNKVGDGSQKIGAVRIDGAVSALGDTPDSEVDWHQKHGLTDITVDGTKMGQIGEDSMISYSGKVPIPSYDVNLIDDCDINKDRLRHLDGTCLSTKNTIVFTASSIFGGSWAAQ